MKIADKILKNILGTPRKLGGKNDLDGDRISNKKDCQPRNTMRQDKIQNFTLPNQMQKQNVLNMRDIGEAAMRERLKQKSAYIEHYRKKKLEVI